MARQVAHDRASGLQPLADPPGGARDPPVHRHGLRLQRVLAAAVARRRHRRAGRLRGGDAVAVAGHDALRLDACRCWAGPTRCSSCCWAPPRPCSAAGSRPKGRARRDSSRRVAWSGGLALGALGRAPAPALAALARRRRDRRLRARARLHLAGLDPDQMVSRPARHGHRARHHGFRGRRDDRRAAGRSADEAFRDAGFRRRGAHAARDGGRSISSRCCRVRSVTGCRRPAGSPQAGRRPRHPHRR